MFTYTTPSRHRQNLYPSPGGQSVARWNCSAAPQLSQWCWALNEAQGDNYPPCASFFTRLPLLDYRPRPTLRLFCVDAQTFIVHGAQRMALMLANPS